MPIKRYNGSAWDVISGASTAGAPGANGTNGADGATYENLLSTTTLSGASTTINSISQAYKHLKVTITGITNDTANGYNIVKPNGSSTVANIGHIIVADPDFTIGFYDTGAITDLRLNGRTTQDRTSANNYYEFIFKNYSSTTLYKGITGSTQWLPGSFAYMSEIKHGSWNITAAISSLVFSNTAGSHTAGTVKIYGIN